MAWCQSKPALPTARGREARDISGDYCRPQAPGGDARRPDRTISVLQGERPGPVAGTGYPADSGDAGSILSEADRTEAILLSARDQRDGCSPRCPASTRLATDSAWTAVTRYPRAGSIARPDAARCVGCQSKWAKRHR